MSYLTIGPATGYYTLTHNTNLIQIVPGPEVISEISPGVFEQRFKIVGLSRDQNTINNDTNTLLSFGKRAELYASHQERATEIWVFEAFEGTIYDSRQALLKSLQITWHHFALTSTSSQFKGEMVIQRGQWEATYGTEQEELNVSMIGGTFTVDNYYMPGMESGRIRSLFVRDAEFNGTNQELKELWVGIREKGEGFSSFVPLQECEIATVTGNDVSLATQTYFNSGEAKRVSFDITQELSERIAFKLSDFTATNRHHFFGEYLVLLGYQHDILNPAPAVVTAQLTGQNVITGEPVILPPAGNHISNIIELGYLRLPGQPLRDRYDDISLGNIGFGIAAGVTPYNATGNLDLDFIILLPARHTLKLVQVPPQSYMDDFVFHEHEDRSMVAYQVSRNTTTFNYFIDFEAQDFRLPADEAMLVFAGNPYFYNHVEPHILNADITLEWTRRFLKYHTY